MKILWFSWKDIKNPLSGGAEVVAHEMAQRLVRDGHDVTIITSNFRDDQGNIASQQETIAGYNVVRGGGRYSVYLFAWRYYSSLYKRSMFNLWKKPLGVQPDIVIEEINTVPFFTRFYVNKRSVVNRYLFVHQLCREIWFYQMVAPISWIGYALEPLYLRLLNTQKVITVSESTKLDLQRYGFLHSNISIISEGTTIDPVESLSGVEKYEQPTILSLGSVRAMKRTQHIVKAFEILKKTLPSARLVIAGDLNDPYAKKVLRHIEKSSFAEDITVHGRVDAQTKKMLMQRAHLIAVTSIKEGWGLIVTEAASQGTTAVVYDVDGLRDSVRNGETGIVTQKNTPKDLASAMLDVLDSSKREDVEDANVSLTLGEQAWLWSKRLTFDNGYRDLCEALGLAPKA